MMDVLRKQSEMSFFLSSLDTLEASRPSWGDKDMKILSEVPGLAVKNRKLFASISREFRV